MKTIIFLLKLSLLFPVATYAQNIGIGTTTPNANAVLDVSSTNKGLLLPRVADTNAITGTIPAGLLIYSNADKQVYFYNGNYWQKSAAQFATDLWYVKNDSVNYTNSKYVGINSNLNQIQPQANLQVTGSIMAQQNTTQSNAAPTLAQTATMNNTATTQTVGVGSDSVFRIFDPGGSSNNYNNNMQGNVRIGSGFPPLGYQLNFNSADFGLGTGDTVWISNQSNLISARDNFNFLFTNTVTAPSELIIPSNTLYIYFRSNADGNNNKGFDITVKKIFAAFTKYPLLGAVGNAFYFNPFNGALRSGAVISTKIGGYSTATGYSTIASGRASAAMGENTVASGTLSTAIGYESKASGYASTSMGYFTRAEGGSSTAMGSTTVASGDFSTSMGFQNVSKAYASLSIGSYNDSIASSNTGSWVPTDPLLIIGNGTSDVARNNALVVYKNGNTDINGYTQLGKATEAAPKIKMKKLIIPAGPAVNAFANYPFGSGITDSKVLGIEVLMRYDASTSKIPPGYVDAAGYEYNVQVQFNGVTIINKVGNSGNIGGKPISIIVTYEE